MSSTNQGYSVQVQVEIIKENKLSTEKRNISKDDIEKIFYEINELDKEILGIEKSNVETKISKYKNKPKCICYIHLRTIDVWIPVTELVKLRCQLMEYIYDDYVERRIAAWKENNNDVERGASPGVNEKNSEYNQAEKLRDKYNEWATVVKEKKKCEKEALSTQKAFEEAEKFYQKVKAGEDLYNSEIKKVVTVFTAVIPDLACFAGCRTSELYPDIAASLENKRRHLKAYLYRNKEVLADLKGIPPFPDLEMVQADSDMERNGMEEDEVNGGIPEEFRGFIEELCNFFERQGNNPDNGNLDEVFDSLWNVEKASQAFLFLEKELGKAKRGTSLIQKEEKDIGEKKRIYRAEAEKIRKRILLYDKHWSYAHLFCMAYPIMKEIDEYPEGEMDVDWCIAISEQLYRLLEEFNKKSGKYRFQWISYNDKEYIESESIKIDFVAGEARWPGLYLCYEDDNDQKHLICVTPGSILEL